MKKKSIYSIFYKDACTIHVNDGICTIYAKIVIYCLLAMYYYPWKFTMTRFLSDVKLFSDIKYLALINRQLISKLILFFLITIQKYISSNTLTVDNILLHAKLVLYTYFKMLKTWKTCGQQKSVEESGHGRTLCWL